MVEVVVIVVIVVVVVLSKIFGHFHGVLHVFEKKTYFGCKIIKKLEK
jgi:hypothetical protein